MSTDIDRLETTQQRLGYRFRDQALLARALTHSSIAESRTASNERLEFLGDAVLGLITCEMIYERYPELLEGEMTKIKSTVVSRQTCAQIARDWGVDGMLALGRGMQASRAMPLSLAAAAMESLVGAVYLDGGLHAARALLEPALTPRIVRANECGHQENFKSVLQQHCQHVLSITPSYLVLDEKGPDHSKCFEVCVEIGSRRFESSWGQSKKMAEQQAALNALRELGVAVSGADGHVRVLTPET